MNNDISIEEYCERVQEVNKIISELVNNFYFLYEEIGQKGKNYQIGNIKNDFMLLRDISIKANMLHCFFAALKKVIENIGPCAVDLVEIHNQLAFELAQKHDKACDECVKPFSRIALVFPIKKSSDSFAFPYVFLCSDHYLAYKNKCAKMMNEMHFYDHNVKGQK